jgi:hypothetical protein
LDNLSKTDLLKIKQALDDASAKMIPVEIAVAGLALLMSSGSVFIIGLGVGIMAFGFQYFSNEIDKRLAQP